VCAIYFEFPQGGISEQASIQSISEKYLHDTIENAFGSRISTKGANASRKRRNIRNRSKAGTAVLGDPILRCAWREKDDQGLLTLGHGEEAELRAYLSCPISSLSSSTAGEKSSISKSYFHMELLNRVSPSLRAYLGISATPCRIKNGHGLGISLNM
jgi:hypothetical protein